MLQRQLLTVKIFSQLYFDIDTVAPTPRKEDPPERGDDPPESETDTPTKSPTKEMSAKDKIDRVKAACSIVAAETGTTSDQVWVSIESAENFYNCVQMKQDSDLVEELRASFGTYRLLCDHISYLCTEYALEYDLVCRSTNWYDVFRYAEATNQDLRETMRGRLEYWYQNEYMPPVNEKDVSAKKKKTSRPIAKYKPTELSEVERERMNMMRRVPDGSLRRAARKSRQEKSREKAIGKARL